MRTIILLTLLILSPQLYANDGLYMQVGLGGSRPIVKPEYRPEDTTSEQNNNLAAQLSLGYQFKNNIVLEGGYIGHLSTGFTLNDHNSINELVLVAGYSFDISKSWSITPRAGISRWKLDSDEGAYLNPGDEQQTITSGQDFTYMLTATYQAFFMTYQGTNFEFGRGRAVIFGANINF